MLEADTDNIKGHHARPSVGWRSGWLLFRRCLLGCGRGTDALLVAEGRRERTDGQMEAGSQLRSLATRSPQPATLTHSSRSSRHWATREKTNQCIGRSSDELHHVNDVWTISPHCEGCFVNSLVKIIFHFFFKETKYLKT
jgi:hypothetical protein